MLSASEADSKPSTTWGSEGGDERYKTSDKDMGPACGINGSPSLWKTDLNLSCRYRYSASEFLSWRIWRRLRHPCEDVSWQQYLGMRKRRRRIVMVVMVMVVMMMMMMMMMMVTHADNMK